MYWDIFTDCFERNPPPAFRKGSEREVSVRKILLIRTFLGLVPNDTFYHRPNEDRLSGIILMKVLSLDLKCYAYFHCKTQV